MHICVYCSSSSAVEPVHVETARELGRLLGQRGHTLVYGGANVGTMGELAVATHAAGGRVIGVLPRKLHGYGLAYPAADELILTDSMAERKALMEERSEAFIALAGGLGTLEELLQALTLKQLAYLQAPIVLLNVAGFWDHLLAHFEHLYTERFAKPETRQLYHVASDPAEALDYVEQYQATPLPKKWL